MKLVLATEDERAYRTKTEELDWDNPDIRDLAARLEREAADETDYIRRAYHFVRDEVSHSWDIQSRRVTRTASEVLRHREGICYAKSNLLAALLRASGIPAGFCYQRLTIGETPETGYCIHALNAVYVREAGRWVRLDARGNKPGVAAEFSLGEERLAFPVREELEEQDYPVIYPEPNRRTMETLRNASDGIFMYLHELPQEL